jgi:hypothetical protein
MITSHRRTTALVTAALAALLLAGCSAGSDDSGAAEPASAARDQSGGAAQLGSQGESGAGDGDTSASGKPASAPGSGAGQVSRANLRATQQQLARRATVALEVKNISQAVAKVRATTLTSDGIVLTENIGTTDTSAKLAEGARVTATTYGEITISVPSAKLDAVIAELGSVGRVIRSSTTSDDVGGQIVDTQSRLETMRVSVERVRGFLSQAKDLTQIVSLEAELTRRQADLEALEAQLASLKDSVAMSPVQVSLTTQPEVVKDDGDDTGFLAGLRSGWDAFTTSATAALTVVGAVLPFAVLFALVGIPLALWLRRRRAMAPAPSPLPQ